MLLRHNWNIFSGSKAKTIVIEGLHLFFLCCSHTLGPVKHFLSISLNMCSGCSKEVLGAQKKCLIEMVLVSTRNIRFGWEIRKKKSVSHSYLVQSSLAVSLVVIPCM